MTKTNAAQRTYWLDKCSGWLLKVKENTTQVFIVVGEGEETKATHVGQMRPGSEPCPGNVCLVVVCVCKCANLGVGEG